VGAAFLRGAAPSAQAAFQEALACLREGFAGQLGALTFRPYGLARLAEAMARPQWLLAGSLHVTR
jgi:hypothetical protein